MKTFDLLIRLQEDPKALSKSIKEVAPDLLEILRSRPDAIGFVYAGVACECRNPQTVEDVLRAYGRASHYVQEMRR